MNNYLSEKRVAYLSLGCKVNAYETEAIKNQLKCYGTVEVPFRESADIYVVNTCTVTNVADRKSRQMLRQAKKRNFAAVVVALGCYVQEFYEKHMEDADIDLLIGNRRKGETGALLNRYFEQIEAGETPERIHVNEDKTLTEYEELSMVTEEKSSRAFIKIQDGCNQFCSYCIIPFARGRISSRSEESVLTEVKALVDRGYQEVILTGIHLSSYGLERYSLKEQTSLSVNEGELPLLTLLRRLQDIPELQRVRLGSLEPRIITEEFVAAIAGMSKVCPHFHLSLQSGCNRTLKNMNRKYTAEEYLAACKILRRYYDMPGITTDIIVGFPMETREDFTECVEFAKMVHFSQIHVFPYSRRKGTVADSMNPQVPEEEKKLREKELLAVEKELRFAYRRQWLGKEVRVLFEEMQEIDGVMYYVGYSESYVPYAISAENDLENRIFAVVGKEIMPDGTILV